MSSNYQTYMDYLASFANSHIFAIEAEKNIYPVFSNIKHLIEHYQSTISKFSNVQSELVAFIDKLNFDDKDFDLYKELFNDLCKIDGYLQELKAKQVSSNIAIDVQNFIENAYSSFSIYNLDIAEEQVLSKINRTYEATRVNNPSGCLGVFLLLIITIIILSFTMIKL